MNLCQERLSLKCTTLSTYFNDSTCPLSMTTSFSLHLLFILTNIVSLFKSHHTLRSAKPITFMNHQKGRKKDLLLTLVAGKRVRVWAGSCTAVLHRSPSLHSAYSAFFSSLTRANTLTDIFHLIGFRLGSTEGQIKQQLQNYSFLIYKRHTVHLCLKKKVDQLLVLFALLLMHLLVFQGSSAKYRKRMC